MAVGPSGGGTTHRRAARPSHDGSATNRHYHEPRRAPSLAVRVPVRRQALLAQRLPPPYMSGHTTNTTSESLICTATDYRRVAGQPLSASPNHRLRWVLHRSPDCSRRMVHLWRAALSVRPGRPTHHEYPLADDPEIGRRSPVAPVSLSPGCHLPESGMHQFVFVPDQEQGTTATLLFKALCYNVFRKSCCIDPRT